MNENYRLNISGDSHNLENALNVISKIMDDIENRDLSKPVEGLSQKLQEVISLTKEVQSIQSKSSDKSFVSAKDMDKTIESTKEVVSQINEIKRAIREVQKQQLSDGITPDPETIDALNKLNTVLDQTRSRMKDVASTTIVGRDSSINGAIRDMERLHTLTEDYYKSINNAVDANEKLKQVRLTNNRVRRNLEKSEISGNMSYQQGVETQQAINSTRSMEQDKQRFEKRLEGTRKTFAEDRKQHASLTDRYANGQINKREYEKERAQIEASIKAREKEIKATESLISEMDKTISYFRNSAQEEFSTRTYDAKRGTFRRTVQERAPSIASHATMGVTGAFTGLYMKGAGISEANRPYTVSLGQQTGQSDYSAVRHNFENVSLDNKLGFNSTDMLKFASDWNSTVGFSNSEALNSGVFEMAKGAKSLGIADEQAYRDSMNVIGKTGAVDSGSDVRAIQSAFVGGIKESGLQGHQEEQLKALATISEQVGSGQTLGSKDMNNLVAMQALLGKTGSRGLMGEQGSQFMSSLDSGIKNGMSSPYTKIAMGWGTEFQGLEGGYDLQKRMDKGISDSENVTDLYRASLNMAGSEKGQRYVFNQSLKELGVDSTIEQSDGLFKLAQQGKLDEKALQDFTKKMSSEGSTERNKNSKDYSESNAGKNDQNKAKTDKQAENIYDLSQPIRDVHSAMAGLPTPIYMATVALGAFSASLIASAGMMGGSTLLNKVSGRFKNRGKGLDGTSKGGKPGGGKPGGSGGMFGVGGLATMMGAEGIFDFFGSGDDSGDTKTKKSSGKQGRVGSFFSKGFEKVKGTVGKSKVASGILGKIGGIFKGGGGAPNGIINSAKGLGNSVPYAGALISALSLGSALSSGDSGMVGGSVGSIGGAGIGGALGTMVLPGIGTAIGAGIGGVVGGSAGQAVGNSVKGGSIKDIVSHPINSAKKLLSIGNKTEEEKKNMTDMEKYGVLGMAGRGIMGMFSSDDSDNKETNQSPRGKGKMSQSAVKTETDTKRRMDAEVLREKNNATETENLQTYTNVLNRFEQLINEAKSINLSGGGSSDSSDDSSGGGSGSLSTLTDGKNWSSKNTVNHDLGKTAKGVTAKSLDKWIDAVAPQGSKMRGMGAKYMEAGKASGLDPRYLIAHSAVETGWGTSNLSGGGDADKGNWFGIGAFDNNPNNGFNYSDGLVGGAKWIKENFYDAGQTTVNKMRNNGGTHEYATDPNWDETIGKIMAGSDKYIKGAGRGGGWSTPQTGVLDNPIEKTLYNNNTTLDSQSNQSKNNSVNNSNTININVTVSGGDSPEETGNLIGESVVDKLKSSMSIFTNEYRVI